MSLPADPVLPSPTWKPSVQLCPSRALQLLFPEPCSVQPLGSGISLSQGWLPSRCACPTLPYSRGGGFHATHKEADGETDLPTCQCQEQRSPSLSFQVHRGTNPQRLCSLLQPLSYLRSLVALRVGNPQPASPWKCQTEPLRSSSAATSWQRGIWLLCRSLALKSQFPRL